jgi:hypothetical protein
MKRPIGEDENGKFEKIAMKWMGPELGYVEVGCDDPEFIEWQKQQYALKISRDNRKPVLK